MMRWKVISGIGRETMTLQLAAVEKFIYFLICLLLLKSTLSFGQDLPRATIEEARREGTVNIHGYLNELSAKTIFQNFEESYPGIKVNYFRSPNFSALLSRIEVESRRGNEFDVVVAGGASGLAHLAIKWSPPSLSLVHPDLVDRAGVATPVYIDPTVISFNTQRVRNQDVPKSYEDLSHPRWKGKLCLIIDSVWLGEIHKALGREKGSNLLNGMAGNMPIIAKDPDSLAQKVGSGECLVGVNLTARQAVQEKRRGVPIDFVVVNPVITLVTTAIISKKAPHPNAAKLFVSWITSAGGQLLLSQMDRTPVRVDLKPNPPQLTEAVNFHVIDRLDRKELEMAQAIFIQPSGRQSPATVPPQQESVTMRSETLSDVDRYISGLQASRSNPQRWAVIIGIEKYQRTVGALYARRDAQSVKEYAQKLLDVPQENIFLLLDGEATKTTLQVLLEERLPRRLKPGDEVFVYYAGHGLADPRTGQPYLLPSDADPQSIQLSGYSAEAFYGALGRLKDQRVVVFLDACFSGIVGRQEQVQPLLLAARPLVLTVEDPALKHGNLTVLAAAQHDQLSNSDPENGHGLFTYHLLRGLVGEGDLNGDGRVRLGELASYVKDAVDRKSRLLYGQTRDQIPDLTPAKLDTGQDIELTSRTGKIPPVEKPSVTTQPRPPIEEPPVVARPRPPREEPPAPPPRLNPFQEFREIRVEVESLKLARGGRAILYLRFYNKTGQDLAIIAPITNESRSFLVDAAGVLYHWEGISGMGTRLTSQVLASLTRFNDWLIVPVGESGTVAITFSARGPASSTSGFSFSGQFEVFPKDRLIRMTESGQQGYVTPSSLSLSLHNIRVE